MPAVTVGLLIWVAALIALPAPLAARILLLAPLVIVPRLVVLLPSRPWVDGSGGWTTLLAAVPLVFAFALAPGPWAGLLALPWVAVSARAVAGAARHGLAGLPGILKPQNVHSLGTDVALAFLGVGAVFALVDRLGLDTGFAPAIVLLTAVHFHFAGFGLLGLGALLATRRPWLGVPVLGLALGIPVTALGFAVPSDAIGAVGAVLVGSSGIGVGLALLTERSSRSRRWPTRAAGVALLLAMPMGIAWSIAILTGARFLDLDTMVRTHGSLNAAGVLIAVLASRREGMLLETPSR